MSFGPFFSAFTNKTGTSSRQATAKQATMPPSSNYLRHHAANPAAINHSVNRTVLTDDADVFRRILIDVGIGHILRHCMMIEPLVTARVPVDDDDIIDDGDGEDKTEECNGQDGFNVCNAEAISSRSASSRQDQERNDYQPDDDDSSGDSSGSGSIGSAALAGASTPALEVILDDSFHGNEGLEMFLGGDNEKYDKEGNVAKSDKKHDAETSQQREEVILQTGKTLFHIAAFYGSHNCIALLAESCEAHFQRSSASSAESGEPLLVRLLSLPTAQGSTALHIAAHRSHPQAVQVLVQMGIDANQASGNGTTAAIIAAAQNNAEVLRVLIDADANLNATDQDGYTPFHAACASGSVDAFRYLYNHRVSFCVDTTGSGIGMDFMQTTRLGFGCANLAAKHNHPNLIDYISSIHKQGEHSPDINQRVTAPDANDTFNLDSPIHIATKHGSVDALKALLRSSTCDKDARDVHGRTALTLAVLEGKIDSVRCFAETLSLAEFELFDVEDVSGMTPLYLASKVGYADIVAILAPISDVRIMCLVEAEDVAVDNRESKTADALTEVQDKSDKYENEEKDAIELPMADRTVSQPPLLAAVVRNHIKCVRILLENGADVNQTDDMGHSALSIAARHGYFHLAELLISAGADLSLRSHRGGGTALQKARKYKHTKIIELLEKHDMLNDSTLEGVV